MEKALPKIDIPMDFTIGTGVTENMLNWYKDYPCRMNAEIFVLCMGGCIEATINLNRHTIRENDLVTLTPGSIIQLHKAEGNLKIYFMIFSSRFIGNVTISKTLIDFLYTVKSSPVIHVEAEQAAFYEEWLQLLIRAKQRAAAPNTELLKCLLQAILHKLKELYQSSNQLNETPASSRNEQICKEFMHLAIQFYSQERNIAFYARKLNITPTHLSNTVKQGTGRTVIQIISALVINDAKAQLKSTDLPINEIAESLNFANVSFFGKYFKRHVGMGPQAYRNS